MTLFKQLTTTFFFAGFLFQGAAFAASSKSCLDLDPFRQPDETYAACGADLQKADLENALMAKLNAQMGEVLYWSARYDLAIEYFTKALTLDSTLVETKVQRGWAFIRTNEPQKAFQYFSDALSEKPDSSRAMFAIGYMYNMSGDKENTFAAFDQALKTSPDYHLARSALADLRFYDRGEQQQGLEEYNKLITFGEKELNKVQFSGGPREFPTKDFYASTLFERALALDILGRQDEAFLDLEWLIKKYPDGFGPLAVKASMFAAQKKFDEAVKFAQVASKTCHEKTPNLPCQNSDATLVLSYLGLRKNKEAADIGRKLLASGRSGSFVERAVYFAGLALKRLGNTEDARRFITVSIQDNSDNRAVLITQLIQNGFYEGEITDELNERMLNGLDACLLDDTCLEERA